MFIILSLRTLIIRFHKFGRNLILPTKRDLIWLSFAKNPKSDLFWIYVWHVI